jgi:S1-C subfamily serine protease/rhodanese-related sulfurtransferase
VRVTVRSAALLLLAGVLAGPGTAAALTIQEAILRAKPAAVLITARIGADISMNCGKGPVSVSPAPFVETGTGWLVDGSGYLVTNAHVVDPAHRLPPWVTHELKKTAIEEGCVNPELRARGLARGQRPDVEETIRRQVTDRAMASMKIQTSPSITVLLSNGTKLPAEVKKFSPPIGLDGAGMPLPAPQSGRDLALLRVTEGVYPALNVSSRDAQIGDGVHILGFPGVILSHELLNKSVSMEASVTNGGISGFKQDAIGQDVIQTDAPAAHGNSGGPAIGNDAAVLGVMTFTSLSGSGSVVQGFNFLIPAKDVHKFLQGTGVRIGESKFNTAWIDALMSFFNDDYAGAVKKLMAVDALLPGLPDVKRALREAEERVKNPPPRPFPWAWVAVGVTFVSVSAYGAMFGQRWWKNRFRIMPTQVIGLIEKGLTPVLLDVRSKEDFDTSPLKLPGAVRLSPEEAAAGRINLDVESQQIIVAYCTTPEEKTSAAVAQLLRQKGFKNIRILKGGLGGWTNARLPVEAKSSLPSIGLEIYKNLTLGDIERRRFAPQQSIFKEGDDAQGEAYVIHAGAVEIRKRFDGTEKVLATMHEGELLGDIGLFRKAPRSASASAVNDVELLVIKHERLEWLMRNRPQLTLEIVKRLAELVVATDRERTDLPAGQMIPRA